jgi:hypothetical protein
MQFVTLAEYLGRVLGDRRHSDGVASVFGRGRRGRSGASRKLVSRYVEI